MTLLALAELPLIERRTLAERVYAHLSDLLASGRVAPGERLSLRDLAEALGVSVMPVREAVSRLIADRALEVAPGRAVRVPVMTAPQWAELATIRAEVEGFAAATAALAHDAAALAEIEAAEAAFRAEALSPAPDAGRAVALNRDLHFAIYRAAGMGQLTDMIGALWLKAGPVLNLDLRAAPERLNEGQALRCHAEAALRRRDASAARAAIAEDICSAAAFILARGDLPG